MYKISILLLLGFLVHGNMLAQEPRKSPVVDTDLATLAAQVQETRKRPIVNTKRAAEQYKQRGFSENNNNFSTDDTLAQAHQICVGYGLGMIQKKIHRKSSYNNSKLIDRKKRISNYISIALSLCAGAATLRYNTSIDNVHAQAFFCCASTAATFVATFIGRFFLTPNIYVLYFVGADKAKRRTLLDGYRQVKELEDLQLTQQQVKALENFFQDRFKKNQYAADDYITPVIDYRVYELLSCAKNNHGLIEIPAHLGIDEQKRREDNLNIKRFSRPEILYNSNGEATSDETDSSSDLAVAALEAVRTYGSSAVSAQQNLQWAVAPVGAILGYCGSFFASSSLPHTSLRAALSLGGSFLGACAAYMGVGALSKCFHSRTTITKEINDSKIRAVEKVKQLGDDDINALEALCSFGQDYGYIPRCDGGWRGSLNRTSVYQYALALVRSIKQDRSR